VNEHDNDTRPGEASRGHYNPATLTDDALQEVIARYRRTGNSFGRCLTTMGWPDEPSALKALAGALNIRFLDLSEKKIDKSIAALVPPEFVHSARIIPVCEEDGRLVLAMENPFDFGTVDHIRILTGKEIVRAVCTESDMEMARQSFYGFSVERMIKHLGEPREGETGSDEDIGHLREIASEPTVVNLVNLIIARAVRDRASDIHVESFNAELKVKYRIDGILHEMPSPPKHLQDAIISRVKIMSDMNITERYVPQDGHIEFKLEGREVDVRVATIPTIHGESVVLRLLDKTSFLMGLDQIGFEEDTLNQFRSLLKRPHGIVLVCGPTGSGKTSTLYAALSEIFTPRRKFITIEDPIEYELVGVNQIPVRPKRGLTFVSGLRAIVRQDPDIIMVGEIRDRETADIAMRSALTGHLVLSSLHTNDTSESITRLLDMGLEPYLIASTVCGILAQRLVRRVCTLCREEAQPTEEELSQLHNEVGSYIIPNMYRGSGCSECKDTGYRGRIAILEILVVDDDIRDFTTRRATSAEIRMHAASRMQTMRQAGWLKVARGDTTPGEVLRATHITEIANDMP